MILVTGASSGIGLAVAQRFAREGKALALVARGAERLEKAAAALRSDYGVPVHAWPLDVADGPAVERWFEENRATLAPVNVVVNNAGFALGRDPIQNGKPEHWEAMFATNVLGLLRVTRCFLPELIRRGDGHVVLMGSVASRWAYPGGNVYSATKRAVSALTESFRLDLVGTGVRVTEIAPGMVETNFSRVRFGGDERAAKAVYANMTPLTAEDIADAVLWAVSRPKHVNVQEIVLYPTDQASPTVVHRRSEGR
jgi:NADP-dependent 3-hydroxy acid dehydrogenase YdfG